MPKPAATHGCKVIHVLDLDVVGSNCYINIIFGVSLPQRSGSGRENVIPKMTECTGTQK